MKHNKFAKIGLAFILLCGVLVLQSCSSADDGNSTNVEMPSIETEPATEISNFSEEEIISAQIDVIEGETGFSEEWYKDNMCAWSLFDGDGFAIDWEEYDGFTYFWVNELQFPANEYEVNCEEHKYVYESTNTDITVHLTYYPEENMVELLYGDYGVYYYDFVSEDEYIAYCEENSENNTTADDSDNDEVTYDSNNELSYSDAEIYQAAYYYLDKAIADSIYSHYSWELVGEAGVSPYICGYTARFRMYSEELHSYQYLRINLGVDPMGFHYVSAGW